MPRPTIHGACLVKMSFRKRLWRSVRGHFRSKVLARHGIGILAATKNGTLAVDPADFNVSRQLLAQGEYDWNEITLLSSLLSPKSRVVVAGAHIGAVLIPLVQLARVTSVMAYEPSPRNYKMLQINLALNDLDEVVDAMRMALGERRGTVRFTENRINTGNSRIAAEIGTLEVTLDTLDATVPEDWDEIDLIIMDIEGAEVQAMRGAARTLSRARYLYVEFAPEQLQMQGSSVAEFIELAAAHFNFARILGPRPQHLDAEEFKHYLQDQSVRRGLLLNILFSKEAMRL